MLLIYPCHVTFITRYFSIFVFVTGTDFCVSLQIQFFVNVGSKNKNQFVLSLRNISISSEKEQTRVRRPSSLRIPLVGPIFGPLPSAASVVMQDLLRKPNTEAAAQMVVENSDRVLVHLINIYDEDAAKSQFGKFDVDHKFN